MPKLSKLLKSLTPEDAKKAIYIDFEGVGKSRNAQHGPRPALLGALVNNRYTGYILENQLRPITKGLKGFASMGIGSRIFNPCLDAVIEELTRRAKEEKRVILYFSDHEKTAIDEHCGSEAAAAFREVSGNAKLLLQKWKNKRPRQKMNHDNSLNGFCMLAGEPVWIPEPPKMGARRGPAAAIHILRKECVETRRWSGLRPAHQQLARDLLKYNREDCVVTRKLAIKAANALAAK